MFYKMIETARDRWFDSSVCTVGTVLDYIQTKGMMRDAQTDAIKTYLYLKICCKGRPLADLFCEGRFNTLDLYSLEVSASVRRYLNEHPEAAALLEYACLTNDKGEQVSEALEKEIKKAPEGICYRKFFRDAFYGVSYTDYLFSLPMGAGKTYLMAAFIYLDLYFAMNEPSACAFAHNFIIFAPSGLKASVVPSLRTIQRFDPSWVLPEPAASDIKRRMVFEVLDQGKTTGRLNGTKNPNVQKIASHQPFSELFGLVTVTNAEKVILDRIQEKDGQITLFDTGDDEKDRQANELRNLIGKLPSLSVFIDEVHHAVRDEIKLRAVIHRWTEKGNINSVIGFSGTPYLERAEKISATETLSVASLEISNMVYYYPLMRGIGNFLKRPIVKIWEIPDSSRIIENGVREFFASYRDTVYKGNLTAKLGIYCGTIEKLEELVYPLVCRIAAEYGIDGSAVLKFHKGNRKFPQPADSQMQFDMLDTSLSRIRVVLLVQIGKEGWDCRSLTGIILSQEGDCPRNMVLQTSCRCLRQITDGNVETALIYLNGENAGKLESQLRQQHHISIKEFMEGERKWTLLRRYDRTAHLRLPRVDFYQLRVKYEMVVSESAEPEKKIPLAARNAEKPSVMAKVTDFSLEIIRRETDEREQGTRQAAFGSWVYQIARESFGTLSMEQLMQYEVQLREVYLQITYQQGDVRCYSSRYDVTAVNANIRKAFAGKREFTSREEWLPQEAGLLNIANFTTEFYTDKPKMYYPEQAVVEKVMLDDDGKLKADPKVAAAIEALESIGDPINQTMADSLRRQIGSHPQKDRSFHYLPYGTASDFEQTFLKEILTIPEISSLDLEVYYNGDRALTEFKIKCYRKKSGRRLYAGFYTPDFLIIQRRNGRIYKVVIVETKGEIYAKDPAFKDKRLFVETEFVRQNNEASGYRRFAYLYLEDTMSETRRIAVTREKIVDFFKEEIKDAH